MTRLQNDYRKMFEFVESMMNKYHSIWQTNNIIVDCMNDLHQYIITLKDENQIQYNNLHGTTLEFKSKRINLTDKAFIIKESLRVYYNLNAMADEIKLYSYKKSYLTRLRANDFYIAVADVSQKATALSAQLIAIGISQQQIDDLATEVGKYYDRIISREKLKERRKRMTADIPEIINNCRLMLKQRLDPCMNVFTDSEPTMVRAYFSVRKLRRTGGRRNYYTVIISGVVKEKTSESYLPNVTVTPETKGNPTVTNRFGDFTLKIFKKHAKALNFELEGYQPLKYLLPEKRIKERKLKLEVEMVKLG